MVIRRLLATQLLLWIDDWPKLSGQRSNHRKSEKRKIIAEKGAKKRKYIYSRLGQHVRGSLFCRRVLTTILCQQQQQQQHGLRNNGNPAAANLLSRGITSFGMAMTPLPPATTPVLMEAPPSPPPRKRTTATAESLSRGLSATTDEAVHKHRHAKTKPPPPLPPRGRPPRLPPRDSSRHADHSAVVAGSRAQAQVMGQALGTSNDPFPAAPESGKCHNGGEDEECLRLAKLMLSPEGLPLRKVTLQGFAIPVALRLLECERENPPRLETLAFTWLEHDTHGFDLRALTGIRSGATASSGSVPGPAPLDADRQQGEPVTATAAATALPPVGEGSRSEGEEAPPRGSLGVTGCSDVEISRRIDDEDSLLLVLSWSSMAEVVLQAPTVRERRLLQRCFELLLSDLRLQSEASEPPQSPPRHGRPQLSRTSTAPAQSTSASHGEDEMGGDAGGAEEDVQEFDGKRVERGRRITLDPRSVSAGNVAPAGPRPRLRRRGLSLSPMAGRSFGRNDGRESDAARSLREAGELRRKAGDVMGRLLAAYDRASDESRAAAIAVGVSALFCEYLELSPPSGVLRYVSVVYSLVCPIGGIIYTGMCDTVGCGMGTYIVSNACSWARVRMLRGASLSLSDIGLVSSVFR